jgi:hypothetical protein
MSKLYLLTILNEIINAIK